MKYHPFCLHLLLEKHISFQISLQIQGVFFFGGMNHWGLFLAWQMLRGLVLYVVQPNPTGPVERLNDSCSVIPSCVTRNKHGLDYPFIWLCFMLVEEPSSKMPSCNDGILHSDEERCSAVIGSLCSVCSQWLATFVSRLVGGRRFPLEDPARTIVGCIWLYELQNKFDES